MKHIQLFENFSEDKNPIIDFVKKESYFTFEESDKENLIFVTRDNGNVGDETPGKKDIDEASRLQNLIRDKFGVESEIEEVGEWVYLKILLKDSKEKITYTLFKHDGSLASPGWKGFSESHPLEELSKHITRWTKIGASEAKELVKKLQELEYNQEGFNTEYVDLKLPSNAMGYDWTIRKTKKS